MKKFIIIVVFYLATGSFAFAQSLFPELDQVRQIKLLESTREDVKKIFGDDDEDSDGDYYSTEIFYIEFSYASGECAEDEDEVWNVAEGKVTEINVIILNSDNSKELKIDLSKLERIKKYENEDDEETEEDPDDYIYYDIKNGISYGLSDGEIKNIKFTPLEENSPALCSNENLREFNSTKEWFLYKLKRRPYLERNPFANVTELALDKDEITVECAKDVSPETKIDSDDTKIITVETIAEDANNDVLTYNYTVSGGKIIGMGAKVKWDLSGVKPGEYTITAGVDDGCGVCGTTKTEMVVVGEPDCFQEPETKDLP